MFYNHITSTPQTEVKDHPASWGVMGGQHIESPMRCWLLYKDNRYKSVATQITHDVGLAPISHIDRKFLQPRGSNKIMFLNYIKSVRVLCMKLFIEFSKLNNFY